jgi:very-short-patch-repair endonuclease
VATGLWREVLPGVLAPAAIEPALDSAAMLWDPRCVLSHHDAARRTGIWAPDTDDVHVTVEWDNGRRKAPGLEVHRSRQFDDRYRHDGFHRWTRPGRTLVDLSQLLTRAQLEASLLSGVRSGELEVAEVLEAAEGLHTRQGVPTLLELAGLWSPERESLLEDKLHGDVVSVVGAGVSRQLKVLERDGSVFARIDVAVEALRLAFEADGLFWHSTDAQIAADQKRDRGLYARGWHTVRFREGPLDNRISVRREVAAVVERHRQDLHAA